MAITNPIAYGASDVYAVGNTESASEASIVAILKRMEAELDENQALLDAQSGRLDYLTDNINMLLLRGLRGEGGMSHANTR